MVRDLTSPVSEEIIPLNVSNNTLYSVECWTTLFSTLLCTNIVIRNISRIFFSNFRVNFCRFSLFTLPPPLCVWSVLLPSCQILFSSRSLVWKSDLSWAIHSSKYPTFSLTIEFVVTSRWPWSPSLHQNIWTTSLVVPENACHHTHSSCSFSICSCDKVFWWNTCIRCCVFYLLCTLPLM